MQKIETQLKTSLTYPNEAISEMFNIAQNDWWEQILDISKQQNVKRKKLVEFLKSKGIINEDKEFESVMKAIRLDVSLGHEEYIRRSDFTKLTSIAIMRGVLRNTYEMLNKKTFDNLPDSSLP